MKRGTHNEYLWCSEKGCNRMLTSTEIDKCTSCKKKAEEKAKNGGVKVDEFRLTMSELSAGYDKAHANGLARKQHAEGGQKGTEQPTEQQIPGANKSIAGMTEQQWREMYETDHSM